MDRSSILPLGGVKVVSRVSKLLVPNDGMGRNDGDQPGYGHQEEAVSYKRGNG